MLQINEIFLQQTQDHVHLFNKNEHLFKSLKNMNKYRVYVHIFSLNEHVNQLKRVSKSPSKCWRNFINGGFSLVEH